MIKSKEEYLYYLSEDEKAIGVSKKIIGIFTINPILKFQRLLRKVEYYNNCKSGILNKLIYLFTYYKFKKQSIKLGFSIPPNVFGPGLSIAHYGTIVINNKAKIGSNCRIHICVNIGANIRENTAPVLGDNVYIGPGAKIYGNIKIGDNITIGTNSVVNKSFKETGVVIAGIPAKVISRKSPSL